MTLTLSFSKAVSNSIKLSLTIKLEEGKIVKDSTGKSVLFPFLMIKKGVLTNTKGIQTAIVFSRQIKIPPSKIIN